MSKRAQELLRQALTLPKEDRADVAAGLLASLDEEKDDPAAVQAAWAREIEARALRVLAGQSEDEAWSDLRGRIARRLTAR